MSLICILICLNATSQNAEAIYGTYLIDEGDSKVEIYQSANGISGKVVWLKKEANGEGPVFDIENSDASLRSRPILGLVVFEGLMYKNGKWYGNIYSPRKGRFVDAAFAINKETGGLDVKIKVAFLTFSRYWARE